MKILINFLNISASSNNFWEHCSRVPPLFAPMPSQPAIHHPTQTLPIVVVVHCLASRQGPMCTTLQSQTNINTLYDDQLYKRSSKTASTIHTFQSVQSG